jgi:DNA modification methylase
LVAEFVEAEGPASRALARVLIWEIRCMLKGPLGGTEVVLMNPVAYLETNVLYCDDNQKRLSEFPAGCIDLIYLDPPFFSNRSYEVIWGDEAEVRSFEDRWDGGINHYIGWMRERMIEIHRVLKDTGSVYLHCDWHASHYLKVMMDQIFAAGEFQNEIIWYYRGAGVSPRRWGRRHDTLLFYTKGRKSWTFNADPVRGEYAEATKERFKHYIGNVRKGGDFGEQALNPKGKHPDDVWEISIVAPSAKARLGYPTQKPEELLERIVLASSNPGDIVLDPFAGCGTTQVVAERLDRQWIGIDISPTAVNLMRRRLLAATSGAADVRLIGMPTSEDDLKVLKPFEFQNWVMQQTSASASPRKSGDMGIDGLSFMYHEPIQVKQSAKVGRNVVDNFETAVKRSGNDTGYIVAFSFTRGAVEEAARAKATEGLNIVLVTVKELLLATDSLTRPAQPLPMIEDLVPERPRRWRGPTLDHKRLLAAMAESADLPPIIAPKANAKPSGQSLIDSERNAQ